MNSPKAVTHINKRPPYIRASIIHRKDKVASANTSKGKINSFRNANDDMRQGSFSPEKTEPISISEMNSSKKSKGVNKEESDRFYNRMMERKRSKEEDISKIRMSLKRKELSEYYTECHTDRNSRGIIHPKTLAAPRESVERVVSRLYGDAENKRRYMNYLVRAKEKMLEKELSGYFRPSTNVRKFAQPSLPARKQRATPGESPGKSAWKGKGKLKFRGCWSSRETPAKNAIAKDLESDRSPDKEARSARRVESAERKGSAKLERKVGKDSRAVGDHAKSFVPHYKAQNIVKRLYDARMKS